MVSSAFGTDGLDVEQTRTLNAGMSGLIYTRTYQSTGPQQKCSSCQRRGHGCHGCWSIIHTASSLLFGGLLKAKDIAMILHLKWSELPSNSKPCKQVWRAAGRHLHRLHPRPPPQHVSCSADALGTRVALSAGSLAFALRRLRKPRQQRVAWACRAIPDDGRRGLQRCRGTSSY